MCFLFQMSMFLNKLSGEPIGLTVLGLFVIDKPTILTVNFVLVFLHTQFLHHYTTLMTIQKFFSRKLPGHIPGVWVLLLYILFSCWSHTNFCRLFLYFHRLLAFLCCNSWSRALFYKARVKLPWQCKVHSTGRYGKYAYTT